jgi:hypothetical protein
MPATFCSIPGRSRSRARVGARRSSNSAEVTTTGASTPVTDRTAVLRWRYVALPFKGVL